jgi:hypothetical protein
MTFSLFGDKFTRHSGITRLMEDLNDGLRTPGAIMLGGGNPAQIPAMNDYFHNLLAEMLQKSFNTACKFLDVPVSTTERTRSVPAMRSTGQNRAADPAGQYAARRTGLGYRTTEYCTDKWQPEHIFQLVFQPLCRAQRRRHN